MPTGLATELCARPCVEARHTEIAIAPHRDLSICLLLHRENRTSLPTHIASQCEPDKTNDGVRSRQFDSCNNGARDPTAENRVRREPPHTRRASGCTTFSDSRELCQMVHLTEFHRVVEYF